MRWFCAQLGLGASKVGYFQERLQALSGTDFQNYNLDALAHALNMPTLIIHDSGDRISPASVSQELQGQTGTAKLMLTSGQGHVRILRNAEVLKAIVQHMQLNFCAGNQA